MSASRLGRPTERHHRTECNSSHRDFSLTQTNGIQFTLRDQQAIRAQTLREAALKAQADVEVLATTLKLKVVRVLSVEESSPATVPLRPIAATAFRRAAMAEAPTPIEPGTIDVAATVALIVEVGPEAR